MNLKEYQEKARSTAIYLDIEKSKIIYPALGLIGECGEVAEKVKKLIRDANWDMTSERASAIAKELGDCCWYLANICCDINLDLNMMYEMRGTTITHQISGLALPRLILHMNQHVTGIAQALEYLYYYDKHPRSRKYQSGIPNHLSHIIVCIEEIARRCGSTLEEVCIANIEKLAERKQRGTLHGEGDNR